MDMSPNDEPLRLDACCKSLASHTSERRWSSRGSSLWMGLLHTCRARAGDVLCGGELAANCS
jgi:hypothetical protein